MGLPHRPCLRRPKGQTLPSKSRRPRARKQPKSARHTVVTGAGLAAEKRRLRARLRQIAAAEKASKRAAKARTSAVQKRGKATKQGLQTIRELTDLGLYKRKKKGRPTKGQVYYANRVRKKFRDLFAPSVKVVKQTSRSKKERAEIARKFKKAGTFATDKAVFATNVPGATSGRLVKDSKGRPKLIIKRRIKTSKRGRAGQIETISIPAVTTDEVMRQRKKLQRTFDRMAKQLTKNRFIRFYVEGKWGSHLIYGAGDFDTIWAKFNQYWDKQGQLYHGATHVRFGIVGPGDPKDLLDEEDEEDETESWRDEYGPADNRGRSTRKGHVRKEVVGKPKRYRKRKRR
jgi:hypothetical protein